MWPIICLCSFIKKLPIFVSGMIFKYTISQCHLPLLEINHTARLRCKTALQPDVFIYLHAATGNTEELKDFC